MAGPIIQCPSIVCDSETAVYSTNFACGIFNWVVTGGAIVSGAGTDSITVNWDSVGTSGFGIVSLSEPCGCPYASTVKIPVILRNATIAGPDTICTGQQYVYTLPLWAATQYDWGVIGDHAAIVLGSNDHTVTVNFSAPGTYTLHGWYQNRITLCGGNVFRTVTVVGPDSIIGPTEVCQNSTGTYALTDSQTANWTLYSYLGTPVNSGSGTGFAQVFDSLGTFVLYATGGFCANPVTIHVVPLPSRPDSVSGTDTVCIGRSYSYAVPPPPPGEVCIWQAIGGTVSPTSGSDTVSGVWTDTGAKILMVSYASTTAPYCMSLADTMKIFREIINPNDTGDTTPCPNSYRVYNSRYTRGETYNWSVYPNTLGSVMLGNHSPVATVLWNNETAPVSGFLVVSVSKCDTTVNDTLDITVTPTPPGIITANDSLVVCPGDSVHFTVTASDSFYIWNFGDGSALYYAPDTAGHVFPANGTSSTMVYTVRVTGIPGSGTGCSTGTIDSLNISVIPGPVVAIEPGSSSLCYTDTVTFVAVAAHNVSGLTYQWYNSSGAISGATDTTYTTGVVGAYYVKITDSAGCTAKAGAIFNACPDSSDVPCDSFLTTVSSSVSCNVITLTALGSYTHPQWYWNGWPPASGPIGPGNNATVIYDTPGVYSFTFGTLLHDTCGTTGRVTDTIPFVADFRFRIHCLAGGVDSIVLYDNSRFLPGHTASSITWSGGIAPGAVTGCVRAAPGTYVITENVTSGTETCSKTYTITLPASPVAAFTYTVSPVCEGVPIFFTYTGSGGIISYYWSFGDSSSNLLENPQRTYTWKTGIPDVFPVTLTVTDTLGCVDSVSHNMDIYHNILSGRYSTLGEAVCSDALPYTLAFAVTGGTGTPPYTYLWNDGTGISTDNIYHSGSYWIKVTDFHQCQQTFFPAVNIRVVSPPPAVISGKQSYCQDATVELAGYAGTGVGYQWFRNGSPDGTAYEIADGGLLAGTYGYMLVLTVLDTASSTYCSDTAFDTVHVYALPSPPTITGPTVVNCADYHLQLTASESDSGTYNWSNGVAGAVDNIYSGGAYRVWFTNAYGCTNHSDTTVVPSVDQWFAYFPTGCYNICEQQMPLYLPGVPGLYISSWAWLLGGVSVESGTGFMSGYNVTTGGTYQWSLNNGLCAQMSGDMNITTQNCNQCPDTFLATMVCDTSTPAGYDLTIILNSPMPGTSYTIGTNIGPVDPFTGYLATAGLQPPMTLSFTTFAVSTTVTVEVIFTLPTGVKCFQQETLHLPHCIWPAERLAGGDTTGAGGDGSIPAAISSALLVFPNPASGNMTISYNYGTDAYKDRTLALYDELGRKIASNSPTTVSGSWGLNTTNFADGIYIVRMEADGAALQTQKVVITHK